MKQKNELAYLIELKKIIRKTIKIIDNNNFEKQIDIIKSILFYISRIILIKMKYKSLNLEDILDLSQKELDYDLELLLLDIEEVEQYKECEILDKEIKINIIKILDELTEENLTEFSLGELYDYFTTNNEKKLLGQVYTPKDIVKEMINSSFDAVDIISNPYYRVLDPACGGGYFLLEAYDKIEKIISENYDEIISRNKTAEKYLSEDIHKFILDNNIWGTDIDGFAIYMTRFSLAIRGENYSTNIFKQDALLDEKNYLEEKSFNLLVANPPYIGHKKINKDYRASLSLKYKQVYSDKGDISYCFFKKAYDLLKDDGKISFITSRYFLESPSGKGLRSFIKQNFSLNTIVDFYGQNVFKGIGISPVIIEGSKSSLLENKIEIYKRNKTKNTTTFKENLAVNFTNFIIEQDKLDDSGWILLSKKEQKIFDKIDKYGDKSLKDISVFKQGIITGCDRAFIIDESELDSNEYEEDLIKPWIKNSDIDKYHLKEIKKYIIYTDIIDCEESYPHVINKIGEYKERLMKRRECKSGIRKWYELQWGREEQLFKSDKIVFPYKSDRNKFTIVREEVCSSADVYFINIQEKFEDKITLEYLVAFLNSKLCEYYFKCIAKKLNEKLYDYYPNKLEILNIKIVDDMSYIEKLVKKIDYSYNEEDCKERESLKDKIDKYFYELYSLNQDEVELIESYY